MPDISQTMRDAAAGATSEALRALCVEIQADVERDVRLGVNVASHIGNLSAAVSALAGVVHAVIGQVDRLTAHAAEPINQTGDPE